MPQRNYLISTIALSLTASGTTIGSGNTTSATFAEARKLIRTGIGAGELAAGSRTWSIHYVVSAMATPYEMRLKLQRLNSSGVMQSESSFGTTQSATGTFDDNITWDSGTWAANDQLALVWEHRRPSGTGSKNGTIDANGSSYIDAPLPVVVTTVTPGTATLTTATFIPQLILRLIPTTASVNTATFAPSLRITITPDTTTLTTGQFAPSLNTVVSPPVTSITLTCFAPALQIVVIPPITTLNTSGSVSSVITSITIPATALTTSTLTPVLFTNTVVLVPAAALSLTITRPNILPPNIIYLDPGGDATHAVGHFNVDVNTTGLITYDSTQPLGDAGSYKFDSDTGVEVPVAVNGVLDNWRRVSVYFRYDSVPDAFETTSTFYEDNAIYSGGGFADPANTNADDGFYATATPARNAGQGSKCSPSQGSLDVPVGGVIDLVKISYERKYDVNTSIGISRVKWVVNGEEGPNYDNTDMPLTDTVVEVDVTSDRGWTWQDFVPGVLEIIAEARRGDTDTAHTQSWDYVKVEVVYHQPAVIMAGLSSSNLVVFQIAIRPSDTGESVLRFVDGAGDSFDGITPLLVNTNYRLSFAYIYHAVDDLEIKLYVDNIEELSITEASTGGFSKPVNFHYGWLLNPGVDHLCWFSHLAIDDGDDLSDIGDLRSTAKLSAAVNEDNWDTTGGTGAVNERPLSETNYIMQTGFSSVRQTYTLQTAAAGDVDLSAKVLRGYMGWAWAKRESGSVERIGLIVNNVDVSRSSIITTSPTLLKHPVTSVNYPSHAAGIGMSSNSEDAGVFMYECGVVVGYEGPDISPRRILAYQELPEGTILDLVDDLRADPPASYEFCYRSSESETAMALITVTALDQENGSISQQIGTPESPLTLQGGQGRSRISAGIEVQVHVEIVGGPLFLGLWHRINVD